MSMTVPTYIRSDDQERYLAIAAKGRGSWTEFVHDALVAEDKKNNTKTVDNGPLLSSKVTEQAVVSKSTPRNFLDKKKSTR